MVETSGQLAKPQAWESLILIKSPECRKRTLRTEGLSTSCCRMAVEEPLINVLDAKPLDESVQVYPNPADNSIHIGWVGEEASFEITDILGRRISKGTLTLGRTYMDVSSYSNGVFYLSVKSKTKTHQLQFSIVK